MDNFVILQTLLILLLIQGPALSFASQIGILGQRHIRDEIVQSFDPCMNNTVLSSLTQRVIGYKSTQSENQICDRYLEEGWYSMGDYVIASTTKDCGTDFNWYRLTNESLPTVGEKELTVCMNDPDALVCSTQSTIKAYFCPGERYVFYLYQLDYCSQAYCIEHKSGKTVIPTTVPTLTFTPRVEATIRSPNNVKKLCFLCEFSPSEAEKKYLFKVQWYITSGLANNKVLRTSSPLKKDDVFDKETMLTEDHMRERGYNKIGFTLACSVTAQEGIAGYPSHPVSSAHKYCGFEVLNKTTITLTDNNPQQTVFIQMTVPFACENSCRMDLELFIPANDHCEVTDPKIKGEITACYLSFNQFDVNKPKSFTITAQHAALSQQLTYLYNVQLRTTAQRSDQKFFENFFLEPIRVHISTDTQVLSGKKCYSSNDPHMRTFEHTPYENQNKGVFVLYNNEKFKQQVQIQTASGCTANPGIFCNCGVVVAAGRDVFTVNFCERKYYPEIQFTSCEDRILNRKIKETTSSTYEITLPTGTKVVIKPSYNTGYIAVVEVYPSLPDKGTNGGLCGTLGSASMPGDTVSKKEAFIKKWKVEYRDSLFDQRNLDSLERWPLEDKLCSCLSKDQNQAISEGFTVAQCSEDQTKTCTNDDWLAFTPMESCALARRKKRDLDYHSTQDTSFRADLQPGANVVARAKKEKRSIQYDKTSATEECNAIFNTSVVQLCSRIGTFNKTSYIENCILDVLYTDSLDWGLTHLESYKRECVHEAKFNRPIPVDALATVNYSDTSFPNNTNGVMAGIDESLLQEIKHAICPNDCSGHGKCKEGQCICDPNFIGFDCSVDNSIPPIMTCIPDNGLCDRRSRPCLKTSVFGRYFVLSDNLSCNITHFKIDNDKNMIVSSSRTVKADRRSIVEARCDLSSSRRRRSASVYGDGDIIAEGYHVSISNNGVLFSKSDTIVTFDSRCVTCAKTNGSLSCELKKGYCVMDGDCVLAGHTLGCMVCSNGLDGNLQLISECVEAASLVGQAPCQSKLWVIGATLGPLGIAITLVVCYYLKIKRKNKARPFDRACDSQRKPVYVKNEHSFVLETSDIQIQ